MRLCAVHGEACRLSMQWKWDSLGIWVVGRIPKPGTYICLSHHSRAGSNRPTLIDDVEINRGYKVDSYNKVYPGPDPLQWQSEDPHEYARAVNAKDVMYPAGEPLCADADRAHRALELRRSYSRSLRGQLQARRVAQVRKQSIALGDARTLPPSSPKPMTFHQCHRSLKSFLKASSGTPYGHLRGRSAHWPLSIGGDWRRTTQ